MENLRENPSTIPPLRAQHLRPGILWGASKRVVLVRSSMLHTRRNGSVAAGYIYLKNGSWQL